MEFFIILILILINGFFSLSEIAVISSKETRLHQLVQSGKSGAAITIKLLSESEKFLSSVQVGITLVGLITGAYSGISLAGYLTPFFEKFQILQPYSHVISISLIMFLTTYVTIVIGELVPKTIALSNPERIASFVAPIINIFSSIFYPFVKLLSASTTFITGMLGIKKTPDSMTETELRQMIKTASMEGVIEPTQNTIHEKVFNFSDKRALHLMTHRIEVEWIDLDESEEEIRKDLEGYQHNKIICCRGSLDHFVGVLLLRDYYKAVAQGKDFKVEEMIVQPVVIHENTSAPKVLEQMKQNRTHICVVVDEYGDFEGIITFHDIMENLVGVLPDEGEIIEPSFFIREDNSVLVNGDAPIEIMSNVIEGFDIDFEVIDYSTVAGFVIDQINVIPKVGDKIDYLDYVIEIIDMDGNRIDKLLVWKKQEEEAT
ncbi:MAG: HlyC/CorC family transporter [Porphyromonadaceae bacterium]|jgi:putative hemolysin|nr:HlyC/CorC family transporter [Porphyromonadaceae bacterium]